MRGPAASIGDHRTSSNISRRSVLVYRRGSIDIASSIISAPVFAV